jgi:hypothetical protein
MAGSDRRFHGTLMLITFFTVIHISALQATACFSDSTVNRKRLSAFAVSSSVAYTGGMIGLHQVWYKNSARQSFRFFNDADEWKQVDKVGHFFSAFYLGYGTSKALTWSNVDQRKSDLIGATTGFLVLLPVEIFDGYSDAYGASATDLAANAAGSVFFLGQKLRWNEVRIIPKYSFHRTKYAPLRPTLLGNDLPSEIIKDYNGQTQWLSFDMDKFMRFPKWLNIAAGYGAEEMIFARNYQNKAAGFDPYRQYYLSIDFDLTAIRTRSKFVKTLIFLASTIKLPAPAVELSRKGIAFHALYF